jgi:signal transduction histidine kinase
VTANISIHPRPRQPRLPSGIGVMAVDAGLALVVTLVCVLAAVEEPAVGNGLREPGWLSVLTAVLIGAPLAVRRLWPTAVAGVVLVASVLSLLTGVIPDYAGAAPSAALACALYAVGVATPRRRSLVVLTACLAGMGAAFTVAAADLLAAAGIGEVGFACLTVVVAWMLGWAVRERRASAAAAADQRTRQAVSDERLRIARELHDVIAHSMSLIAVKSAVANHVADVRPQESRAALQVIEETSRASLLEIRRVLGILRDNEATYAPVPGLADLNTLVEQAAVGGIDVKLEIHGGAGLPESVGLSTFRIVQEAVTNVVRHATPANCRAIVAIERGEVRIEVTDDGRGVGPPHPGGHGLIGIRERAALYGGDFSAGPRPDGGFAVTVRLPYGATS